MIGRITSTEAPPLNRYGVPYRDVLELEQARNQRFEALLWSIIAIYERLHSRAPNDRRRSDDLAEARELTQIARS